MSSNQKPILLVCPPSLFFDDDRMVPTLSHLYVAGALERGGFKVDVLDIPLIDRNYGTNINPFYLKAVEEKIRSKEYQAVGVTALSPQMREVIQIGERVKQVNPNIKLIMGGAHPSLDHICSQDGCSPLSGTPDYPYDKIIVGDGEEAIFEALNPNNQNRYIHANIIAEKLEKIKEMNGTRLPLEKEINTYIPARHLTDIRAFSMTLMDKNGINKKATTDMWQRGCPFGCVFCGGRLADIYRIRRTKTPEIIVRELEEIRTKYGIDSFVIYDDEVNLPPWDTFYDLMSRLKGRGFIFRSFIKTGKKMYTEEVAKAMAEAGFVEVATGVESGSNIILNNIQKKTTREENFEAARITTKYKMRFKSFLSVGHPGETVETIKETASWAKEVIDSFGADNVYATVSLIAPYPGTPIFDKPESLGHLGFALTKNQKEIDYTKERTFERADAEYNCLVRTDRILDRGRYKVKWDGLSPEQLIGARSYLENVIKRYQKENGISRTHYSSIGHANNSQKTTLSGTQYDASMGQTPPKS